MKNVLSKVTCCKDITLVTLSGLSERSADIAAVFGLIAEAGVNVDMICQTPPSGGGIALSFTIADSDMSAALDVIGALNSGRPDLTTGISQGYCKLSFYGEDMKFTKGVGAAVFETLSKACGNIALVTTSAVDISVLLEGYMLPEAVGVISEWLSIDVAESDF